MASDTPANKPWWRAEKNDEYWFIDGKTGSSVTKEKDGYADKLRHQNHNYFRDISSTILYRDFMKATTEAMVCDGKYTILADGKVEFDQKYPASLRFDSDSEAKSFVRLRKEYVAMLRRHFR